MDWGYMQGKVEKRIGSMKDNCEVAYIAHMNGKLDRGHLEFLAAYDVFVSENTPEDIMDYKTLDERSAILNDILSSANRDMSKITGQDEDIVGLMVSGISKLLQVYKDTMAQSQ
ncbi:MAG: hypothetical protein V1813_03265 [Candidatus Aenigmatarchaeota archaeon]